MRSLKLTISGTPVVREVADNRLLVDFLREDLKLTGVIGRAILTPPEPGDRRPI